MFYVNYISIKLEKRTNMLQLKNTGPAGQSKIQGDGM